MNWLQVLREWWLGPGRTQPAPPPDIGVPFHHERETQLDVVYSADHRFRAVVTRDDRGLFRVHRQVWDTGDWEAAADAFWGDVDATATITDTFENARKLATEDIAALTDGSEPTRTDA
jgi:hypothetical protein